MILKILYYVDPMTRSKLKTQKMTLKDITETKDLYYKYSHFCGVNTSVSYSKRHSFSWATALRAFRSTF